jgi:DNA-binding response OmpR family regulator
LEASRLDLSFDFDDLVLAPYRISELAVRLRLARWRAEAETSGTKLLRAGALSLNEATYEVTVSGVPLELTLKEYQLLLFLLHHPGRVFTRAEILDRVWGMDYYGGTRTVDVHIRRLRSKTEAAGEILETIRGVGYRLVPPAEPAR